MTAAVDEDAIAPPTLLALFFACGRIGMLSFGGSVSAMMHVDFVTSRRWVSESDFLEGLAIAQALPGVNVTNLSIWLGYRLHGPVGAIVACLGSILPPAILIVIAGALLQRIEDVPTAMLLLAGLGAAALGMSMTMGLRSARHAADQPSGSPRLPGRNRRRFLSHPHRTSGWYRSSGKHRSGFLEHSKWTRIIRLSFC